MVLSCPDEASMWNDVASGPSSVYVSTSPSSSAAVTGNPMARPGRVFSGKLRTVEELANAGASGTSVTATDTRITTLSPLGSVARTVTV